MTYLKALLCHFGFHPWSRWSEERVEAQGLFGMVSHFQTRECRWCNRTQRRLTVDQ